MKNMPPYVFIYNSTIKRLQLNFITVPEVLFVMNTEFPRGRGLWGSAVKPPGTEDPGGGFKLEKTLPSRVLLQYCAKVMQMISMNITLCSRDLSPIYQQNIAWIAERISRRDIVLARLRCNDISQSKTIYHHDISLQRRSL